MKIWKKITAINLKNEKKTVNVESYPISNYDLKTNVAGSRDVFRRILNLINYTPGRETMQLFYFIYFFIFHLHLMLSWLMYLDDKCILVRFLCCGCQS